MFSRIIMSLMLLSASQLFCQVKNNHYDKMIIKYVDLELETPVCITCDLFEKYFKYDSLVVSDKKKLKNIVNDLSHLKCGKRKYIVDARIKIECFIGNKITAIYCLDSVGILNNQEVMDMSKKLLGDIKGLIANKKNCN
jgi:hypothetical protein